MYQRTSVQACFQAALLGIKLYLNWDIIDLSAQGLGEKRKWHKAECMGHVSDALFWVRITSVPRLSHFF